MSSPSPQFLCLFQYIFCQPYFFDINISFLATLAALHFTPVSESADRSAEFLTSEAKRLASLFCEYSTLVSDSVSRWAEFRTSIASRLAILLNSLSSTHCFSIMFPTT